MLDTFTREVIGAFLRLYRAANGMKQETLAGVLEMNHTQLSYLERGKRTPTAGQLVRISRKCNVCINDLLGIECPNAGSLPLKIKSRSKKNAVIYAEELLTYFFVHNGKTAKPPLNTE